MRLATIRTSDGRTRAVRVDGDALVDLGAADVGELLARPGWAERAARADGDAVESAGFAPVVPRPGKIVCIGLNYRTHILEMGRELPRYPTLFAKYAEALIGAYDEIRLPPESGQVDWEAELAVVIGGRVRRAGEAEAEAAIAGFAVLNDVTMRDWQYRSPVWLQGKTWEASTPFGPYLVTPDELPGGTRPSLTLTGYVDGEVVQRADTSDLVFDPVALVRYVSTIVTLNPGDVIATGTPGGVGHAREPARYLTDGSVLATEITGLGRAESKAVAEKPAAAEGVS
ncbi:Fumarylacetoacetate hydrolase family protein [[Actinomadura] parvosata subsp. kistnae]|uniref:2-hydroxyhepta-2,4-diene-1,7-dioate isomerase n=1 Tax=[Actinomadura] parvosata subsp. kistnae TaxID=1909395 RepID=A0A1U9ZRW8_9ACTN|nr:fumarylacetoacetate hydrolase family protein [Nonomuraea sp. ATCC 55076]AQZ60683.1 2-hydroxyhepta-2,4-diene-1,7-dioate isomerase [Nonomuraea sp. ATCC 55076]SPL90714.1 Fumarylacetoacetate hydrolase family protein [Actinomadura parvosata subsp. kistnae]